VCRAVVDTIREGSSVCFERIINQLPVKIRQLISKIIENSRSRLCELREKALSVFAQEQEFECPGALTPVVVMCNPEKNLSGLAENTFTLVCRGTMDKGKLNDFKMTDE